MDIQELYQRKQNLYNQANDLKVKAKDEQRELNAEEIVSWEKYLTDMESLDKQIELATREAALAGRMNFEIDHGKTVGDVSMQYDEAFEKWMRFGASKLSDQERSILSVDESGNVPINFTKEIRTEIQNRLEKRTSAIANPTYLAPISLAAQYDATSKAIGPWMEACTTIYTQTGETMYMPYTNDAGNDGGIEAEGTDAIASSTDLTQARQQLDAYWFSSTGVVVGRSTLRDTSYPVNDFIIQPLMDRLARAISAVATTGNGSSTANGITNAAVVGEIVSKNTTPTATDMNNLLKLVDYSYHTGPKSGWMFNSNTMFRIAATVKSSTYNTEPLWQPSLAAGIPQTLYGYKYWINNSMSSVSASTAKVMLFGDFSKFVLRYTGPLIISRLEERYAETGSVGFLVSQYFDSEIRVVGTTYAPIKYLRTLGT